jgi:PleD family two-component response regulator
VITYDGQPIKVTISMGGTTITRDSLGCMNELIKKADAALYKSKTSGKNMIVFS